MTIKRNFILLNLCVSSKSQPLYNADPKNSICIMPKPLTYHPCTITHLPEKFITFCSSALYASCAKSHVSIFIAFTCRKHRHGCEWHVRCRFSIIIVRLLSGNKIVIKEETSFRKTLKLVLKLRKPIPYISQNSNIVELI